MARPSYYIEKDGEKKIVSSAEMTELTKNGWNNLGKVPKDEQPKQEIKQKPKEQKDVPKVEVFSPQFEQPKTEDIKSEKLEEIQTEKTEKIDTKETKETEVTDVDGVKDIVQIDENGVPEDLVCTVCGAKSKTYDSYRRNHGANCKRRVGKTTKPKNKKK